MSDSVAGRLSAVARCNGAVGGVSTWLARHGPSAGARKIDCLYEFQRLMASVETSGRHSVRSAPPPGYSRGAATAPASYFGRSAAVTASVVLLYLAIGLIAFWPVLPGSSGRLFGQYTGDPALTAWFLGWATHALLHGQNLFFSHVILVPHGVNLMQNTSVPLLGILATPVTLIFGPVSSANLLMVLAMPLSATAAFVVLRKWQVWSPAAGLGGLVYGFSPYMVGQSLGHLSLVFVPLPPFIALVVVAIFQRRGSELRLGITLGLLITAQFLISPEVLATVAILIAFGVLAAGVRYREHFLPNARHALVAGGVAIAVAVVLLAYPIWMMVAGPERFSGTVQGVGNPYYNDLFSFAVPGPLQRVSLGMRALGARLIGGSNPAESGGYIGLPILVLCSLLAFRSRRSPRMQLTVLLVCVAGLISLGPHLSVDGHLTHIPLPDLVLNKIPLLNNLLPARVSFEVDACVAGLLAFGIDDLTRPTFNSIAAHNPGPRAAGIAFSIVTVVLVASQLPEWPFPSQAAPTFPSAVQAAIPSDEPIAITYPYTGVFISAPMAWQAESGFTFRLSGGYALHPSPTGTVTAWPYLMAPPTLQQFLAGETPPSVYGPSLAVRPQLVAETREALAKNHIRLVLVERSMPNSGLAIQLFTRAIRNTRPLG